MKKDASAAKIKQFFTRGLNQSLKREEIRGLARQGRKSGMDSFFLMPAHWAAGKVFGKGKTSKATWKYLQRPILEADTAAGNVAKDVASTVMPKSWAKSLFTTKEQVPTSSKRLLEIERPSLVAPAGHVSAVATPIIVANQLNKGVDKLQKAKSERDQVEASKEREREKLRGLIQGKAFKKVASALTGRVQSVMDGPMDKEQLKKAASAMLQLHRENKKHEKRAHAERVLFKMAEAGFTELPKNFGEFEQKLASLMNQDLAVLEKALELSGGTLKFGELDTTDSSNPQNATEAFQAAIMGELT